MKFLSCFYILLMLVLIYVVFNRILYIITFYKVLHCRANFCHYKFFLLSGSPRRSPQGYTEAPLRGRSAQKARLRRGNLPPRRSSPTPHPARCRSDNRRGHCRHPETVCIPFFFQARIARASQFLPQFDVTFLLSWHCSFLLRHPADNAIISRISRKSPRNLFPQKSPFSP